MATEMNDEMRAEIIRAFAYDHTAAEVAEAEDISLEEAELFQVDYADAISLRKEELKGEEWE